MLLKSRASLTRFRACFLPGQAKDLSARLYSRDSDEAENLTSDEEIVLLLASYNKIPIRFCEHVEGYDGETCSALPVSKIPLPLAQNFHLPFQFQHAFVWTYHTERVKNIIFLLGEERISYFVFNISDLRVGSSTREIRCVSKIQGTLTFRVANRSSEPVSPKRFCPRIPFWLRKIITDPHILPHVNIVCPDDRYPKLQVYISNRF